MLTSDVHGKCVHLGDMHWQKNQPVDQTLLLPGAGNLELLFLRVALL